MSLLSLLLIDAMRVAALLTNGTTSLKRICDSGACLSDLFGRSATLFAMISLVVVLSRLWCMLDH